VRGAWVAAVTLLRDRRNGNVHVCRQQQSDLRKEEEKKECGNFPHSMEEKSCLI
jgi:hypothetical protein